MFNLLIVEDNLYYSKNLINFILRNNFNIKLVGIATNGKEALKYLISKEYNIDIILLDLKLPYYTGIELIEKLKNQLLYRYENSIIVVSGESYFISIIKKESFIYSYIDKMKGFQEISNKLNDLVKLKLKENAKDSLRKRILAELKYLNYNENFVGTQYLLEAILILAENNNLDAINLKRDIFPIIALRHKKTSHNIKCNINNATTIMNCDCQKDIIMKYFNFSNTKTEVKPKQVIETILKKIIYSIAFYFFESLSVKLYISSRYFLPFVLVLNKS